MVSELYVKAKDRFFIFIAAILSSKSILEMTEEEYSRTLNVDLFAAYWVCGFYCWGKMLNALWFVLAHSTNSSVDDGTKSWSYYNNAWLDSCMWFGKFLRYLFSEIWSSWFDGKC